jgi:hypothetical protein
VAAVVCVHGMRCFVLQLLLLLLVLLCKEAVLLRNEASARAYC